MFIGHFAVGFAAKKITPSVSLGMLFLAAQFADLLWPTLVLLRIETVEIKPGATAVTSLDFIRYPYSHSLMALILWALVLGLGYVFLRGARPKAGAVIGALVLSHWVLDVLTHRPDMPITMNGSEKLGIGLWNSKPGTIAVEMPLFIVGTALYASATTAMDRIGRFGFGTLVSFLVIVYLLNLFGPPPPNAMAVAWAAEAIWLLIAWGYWVDQHRHSRHE